MKTTPAKAQAYIQAMPRAALELLALNVLNVLALEHDEEHPEPVLTDEKVQDSMCDAYDAIDGSLRDSGLTIDKIAAFNPAPAKAAAVSAFHAFHWPDHVIGKRESRRIRDSHNALYNSHHELLTAIGALLDDVSDLDDAARAKFGGPSDRSVVMANEAVQNATAKP